MAADPSSVRRSWSWAMPSYETKKQSDGEEPELASSEASRVPSALSRRHSTVIANARAGNPAEQPKGRTYPSSLTSRVLKLKERVTTARDECLDLRQEASDLQEYSNAKLGRVTRYLGVLAEKARKLDEAASDSEDRLTPLKKEKKKIFNDLLTLRGNIRVFVRVRPQFEDEGPMAVSFPDDYIIRVSLSAGSSGVSAGKKEFEFDRVYGPHVGQASIFQDVQPLVQSSLDGYNVCVFAYGQTGSGKTHTMEGPSHDRGLYFRAFEELFDLSITESTPTFRYSFYVTMFELYNEQVHDLLANASVQSGSVQMGNGVELIQQQVHNPADFARIFRAGNQGRGGDTLKPEYRSHMAVTIHIHHTNTISGEKQYSKLSMIDMAGSERLNDAEAHGNRLTESLHVNKALSALGDVLSSLTGKKENPPYSNSKLTEIFSDSLGHESKTLIIVNLIPSYNNVQETISSLSFAARARNVEPSLGNRDSIKKWRDVANDARKDLYEKEKVVSEQQQELMKMKKNLKESDDQCLLLFNEVQKAWKVAFDLQAELGVQQAHISKLKAESSEYAERCRLEKERNSQLSIQVAQLSKIEQDQRTGLLDRGERIQVLEARIKDLQQQSARKSMDGANSVVLSKAARQELQKLKEENENVVAAKAKLEEELSKRDELIERLHQENEKLFERLTDKSAVAPSPKVSRLEPKDVDVQDLGELSKNPSRTMESVSESFSTAGAMALLKPTEKVKTTPAGEYLTSALEDFNPDQYDGLAAIADGANKLLMLVLAAVIKAGAAREHEMLAEIRVAVFSFIRRLEPLRVMDTMLVSRVRILYIRSLLSRSSDLQSIKMPPVDRFLEKAGAPRSRGSSRGSSPARSPVRQDSKREYEEIPTFKVQLKQERKSKFSSMVLKIRGIDQETLKQQVTGAKLKEMTDDARLYAVGNKTLAALFVHTPAGELQRQIRAWLAENFDFLSLTGATDNGGVAGQLELLSTAIMDGWMSGLGIPSGSSTDALGQLLSDYTKRIYTSQLQHLKDVSATLATEEADELSQTSKLRSALESVEHKRRKVLQQMRSDVSLLTKEEGGSPLKNPPTASEEARVASLIALEEILKTVQEIQSEVSQKGVTASGKKAMLQRLNEVSSRMAALLSIDHACAQNHIVDVRRLVETADEQPEGMYHSRSRASSEEIPVPRELSTSSGDWATGAGAEASSSSIDLGVQQWSVLQFNNGTATPFVIKCGATPSLQLVVKAQASVADKSGRDMVAPVPPPSTLAGMSLEEIKESLSGLPEALCQLALARTADGTRARYARLFKTLAVRVPALRSCINAVSSDGQKLLLQQSSSLSSSSSR